VNHLFLDDQFVEVFPRRSAAIRKLPDLNPTEGDGLTNFDVLLKCQVVVAHAVGQSLCPAKLNTQIEMFQDRLRAFSSGCSLTVMIT
jgi:hypothetical protein